MRRHTRHNQFWQETCSCVYYPKHLIEWRKLMKYISTLVILIIAFSASQTSQAMPVLQVDGSGQLTGATGVDVGGILYDVEFRDGTCISIFSTCDNPVTDFTFQSLPQANNASTALKDQVFIDSVDGLFDTSPFLTTGIASAVANIYTPYNIIPGFIDTVSASVFVNHEPPFNDIIGNVNLLVTNDTILNLSTVYAKWSVKSSTENVPAPPTILLLGVALASLRIYRNKAS